MTLPLLAAHLAGRRYIDGLGWIVDIVDLGGRDFMAELHHVNEPVTLRQAERLVQRTVDENRVALDGLEAREKKRRAWAALLAEGEARKPWEGGAWSRDGLSGWLIELDIETLVRFRRVLERIYGTHKAVINAEAGR